jgi:uncharacterized membrane protein YesL
MAGSIIGGWMPAIAAARIAAQLENADVAKAATDDDRG